jgi:4-hydroxyphenylpyruvate dioxygenase-like putative hemolysin
MSGTQLEQLQFHLQFMGVMAMAGRVDDAEEQYRKAQQLLAEMIEAERAAAK